jgi:hypothetical protein
MVKEIILILLLINGEVSLPSFPFHGDELRVKYAVYREGRQYGAPTFKFDRMLQGWYLKDGIGTWHGVICR